MKKLWIGCLVGMCFACNKVEHDKSAASAPPAPSAPAEQAAPSEAAPKADDPAVKEAKAIASLKSDPAGKLKAYVGYNQRWLDMLKRFGEHSEEYKAKEKAGQHEGVTGFARTALELHGLGTEAKTAMDNAKAESGLSDEELTALKELTIQAQMQEQMQKGLEQATSAESKEQVAKLEQFAKTAPADQREQMNKQLEEIKQAQVQMRDMANMKEMRAKYGDAVVDATLAVVPQLNAQMKQYQATAK
ncbi:MAG TPA: hypothetical protein VJV78_45280 [Polyangiales bacterium]|nr:hypothetical protein [Polyangiales bacterium]